MRMISTVGVGAKRSLRTEQFDVVNGRHATNQATITSRTKRQTRSDCMRQIRNTTDAASAPRKMKFLTRAAVEANALNKRAINSKAFQEHNSQEGRGLNH